MVIDCWMLYIHNVHIEFQMTIADLSIVATLSTVNMILPVDADKWPRLAKWFARMRERQSYKTANEPGLGRLHGIVKNITKCQLYDYRF